MSVNTTSRESIILEGFLKKKSPKSFLGRHPWQERYFALWNHQLCYYKKKEEVSDDEKCLGFLLVANMKEVELSIDRPKCFNVVLEGVSRQFELEAPSEAVARQWVDTIRDVLRRHGQKPISLATSIDAQGQKFWKPQIHKKLIIRRQAISAESGFVDVNKLANRSFTKTAEEEEILLKVIRQNIAFRIMDEDAQKEVVRMMWKAEFIPGERVVQLGMAVRDFYIVTDGCVDYLDTANDDEKFPVSEPSSPRRGSGPTSFPSTPSNFNGSSGIFQAKLMDKNKRQKGESFGDLALLYENNATYSVTALVDTVCFGLDRAQYKKLVETASEKRFALRMKFLKNTQVLSVLPDNLLNKISEALEERTYQPGEQVVVQNDPSDSFFIVLSGRAYAESDGVRVKTYENSGEYFGERSLVSNDKRPATVTAESECTFLYLTRRDFVDLMGRITDAQIEEKLFEGTDDLPPPPPPDMDDPDMLPPPPPPPGDSVDDMDIPPAPERPADHKATQTAAAGAPASGKYTNIKLHLGGNTDNADGKSESADHFSFAAPEPVMTVSERKMLECPVQSLGELKIIGTLGRGTFGHVQLVADKNLNTYALKAVNKAHVVRHNQIPHILNERSVMMELEHPFVVRLHRTMRDQNFLYFLLEPSLGGELFSVLRTRDRFDNDTARFYAAIVVSVFQYMHSLDILYRDLKPENLLMDGDGYLRVTDFGFAKKTKDRTYTFCGTPDYLAPEIVASAGHHTGADWWTLGILIYEMLAGYTPFYDEAGPTSMYSKILAGKLYFPSFFPREAQELIQHLLQTKPTRRLGVLSGGADLIKRHAWFAGLDWNALHHRKIPAPIPVEIKDKYDLSNFDAYPDEENQDEEFNPDPANPDWDSQF